MEFSTFEYSEKHNSLRILINIYRFNINEIDVWVRPDYKIIVTDGIKEKIIPIPDRIKPKGILCKKITDSVLMIELELKNLDINVTWV
jgi:hypothetical protein